MDTNELNERISLFNLYRLTDMPGGNDLVDALYEVERVFKSQSARIAALEARTAETGLMGRVIRRVEALEDNGNYGSTVINHEARLKALEAAREPAPAPEMDTVTISRAQWERLANEVEFWMTESVAMANAITDDTVVRFQNARNSIIHIIKEVDPTF